MLVIQIIRSKTQQNLKLLKAMEFFGVLGSILVRKTDPSSVAFRLTPPTHPGVAGWGLEGRITPESRIDSKHSWLV